MDMCYCTPEFLFCLVLEQWWPKDTPFVSELDLWEANERIVEQALILQYSPKWKLPHCIFSYILEIFVNGVNCIKKCTSYLFLNLLFAQSLLFLYLTCWTLENVSLYLDVKFKDLKQITHQICMKSTKWIVKNSN